MKDAALLVLIVVALALIIGVIGAVGQAFTNDPLIPLAVGAIAFGWLMVKIVD